eukprot:Skav218023  [mRNA]  locus=scaffold214:2289:6239:- [translate_table: standard]
MCTAFTPQLTDFLAKNGEKSAVLDALKRKFRLWGGKEKPTFGEGRRGGIPALVVINEAGDEVKYLDAESKGAAALEEWFYCEHSQFIADALLKAAGGGSMALQLADGPGVV